MQGACIAILLWGIAYLFGSISSAVLICQFFKLPDPRTQGSKNPGATNVLRLAGLPYAVMVLIFDFLKGLFPVLLAYQWSTSLVVISMTSFFAVIGHMYPVFFRFEGGKGVATAMGALIALHFMLGVVVVATWFVVVSVTRFSSLAALVSIGLSPFYGMWMMHSFDPFAPLFLMAVFVFYRHHANISRLLDGTEPKMFSRPAPTVQPTRQVKTKPKPKSKQK